MTRSMSHTPTRAALSVSSSSRWRSYGSLLGQIPLADHLGEELERYGDEDQKRLNGEGVLVLRHVGERPVAMHRAEDGEACVRARRPTFTPARPKRSAAHTSSGSGA